MKWFIVYCFMKVLVKDYFIGYFNVKFLVYFFEFLFDFYNIM